MIALQKGVAATVGVSLIAEPAVDSAIEFRIVAKPGTAALLTKVSGLTATGTALLVEFSATELDDIPTEAPVFFQVWVTPSGGVAAIYAAGVMSVQPGTRVVVTDPPAPHARSQQPVLFRAKRGSALKLRFQVLRDAEPVNLTGCTGFKFSLIHPTLKTETLSFVDGGTGSALVTVDLTTGTFDLTATAATMALPLASYIAAFQFTHPDEGLVEAPSESSGYRFDVVQDFVA